MVPFIKYWGAREKEGGAFMFLEDFFFKQFFIRDRGDIPFSKRLFFFLLFFFGAKVVGKLKKKKI